MAVQLMGRSALSQKVAYGLCMDALIEYYERNKIEYVHGNDLPVELRKKYTTDILYLIGKKLKQLLKAPDYEVYVDNLIEEMFEEYLKYLLER